MPDVIKIIISRAEYTYKVVVKDFPKIFPLIIKSSVIFTESIAIKVFKRLFASTKLLFASSMLPRTKVRRVIGDTTKFVSTVVLRVFMKTKIVNTVQFASSCVARLKKRIMPLHSNVKFISSAIVQLVRYRKISEISDSTTLSDVGDDTLFSFLAIQM